MLCWTEKTPEKPGFYFYHPPGADPRHVWIAQVTEVRDKSLGLFASFANFKNDLKATHQPVGKFKGKWQGPIPDPGPCD